jgi:hypothetical protein
MNMLVPLFVPMAVFAMATAVVALITGIIATGMLHSTLREAMRNHPESVPALVAALRGRAPWADALLGWIALAFGATIVLLSLFEDGETRTEFLKASVLPFVIGIVVLVYLRVARPRTLPPA